MFEILPFRLQAEPGRVVVRPFQIAPEPRSLHPTDLSRAHRVVSAVLAMDVPTCQAELALVNRDFEQRHWQTRRVFLNRYQEMKAELGLDGDLSEERKELIGAYFCHEYSYASAALMNPSITPHPDQTGLVKGAIRVVLSLRAVGEGHISSIVFREGILDHLGGFELMPRPPFSVAASETIRASAENGFVTTAARFAEATLSGTVIFPFTQQQKNGLEDLRLVRMRGGEDDGLYVGTYTAYSGSVIVSEMMLTRDFRTFELHPLNGVAARSKGMALFPRKIDGAYAMIGRMDGESLYFLRSDDLFSWEEGAPLLAPHYPWELIQIGNCGAPVELDEGWLLLTHGVGAMRKYSIGAALLDKSDPTKVLARTKQPIVAASDDDREGYVPNVVYTCGALAQGRRLFMPFGVADSSVAFGFLDLDALLGSMQPVETRRRAAAR
jgi:predicted GH43/DUF377 family glycosyl hydrolase